MTADGAFEVGQPVVLRVDRERCIGSGMCALTVPASLALGPDGRAHPLGRPSPGAASGDGTPGDGAEDTLTEDLADAVDLCPVEALTLHRPPKAH